MKIIDSHQHFWQISRGDYTWLTPELSAIYQDFLPIDLSPQLEQAGVCKTVLVQAAASVAETDFMLSLADQHDFIQGVVGWVDMQSEDAVKQIERLSQHAKFKGIRPMLQDIADVDWILQDQLAPVFDALLKHQLRFDALVLPKHLANIKTLIERYPTLPMIIDHAAKPDIANNEIARWQQSMTEIANFKHVYCKLSGLVTEAGDSPSAAKLQPYVNALVNLFGAERLIWGSDWPVVQLANTSYQEWLTMAKSLLVKLTPEQQQQIFANNAEKFYQL